MIKALRIAASSLPGMLLLALCANAIAKDSPSQIRSEIAKTEKQYIDLYNKLNTDPQFEYICRMEKPTGTNFATRVCRPRYLLDAMQASASEVLHGAVSSSANTAAANSGGPNVGALPGSGGASTAQPDKDAAFSQNVLEVQKKSPELQALGKKRDELGKQLEATKN